MPLPSPPGSAVCRIFARSRLELVRGDITEQPTDAIVNAANGHLLPGAGVCGAIHSTGGDAIFDECAAVVRQRGPLLAGEAALTGGGRLLARHVIHAVGPVWHGGSAGEPEALASCYRSSLALAVSHGLRSVAFPSISTGIFGYPVAAAAAVALRTVAASLVAGSSLELVRFVLWSEGDLTAYREVLQGLPD